MISLLIGILIIVVVGAICFWAIEKFALMRSLQIFSSCLLYSFVSARLCND